MKTLESVNIARLSNLEFGQHVKSVYKNISFLGDGTSFITDPIFINYLSKMNDSSTAYDEAMMRVFKSDETAKIVAADRVRDLAVTSMTRYLSVFELSEIEEERLAHTSLNTLLEKYKGIQTWNFEEESNGIESLVNDLNGTKYQPNASLINMNGYISRLMAANVAFKSIFDGRTQEASGKEVFDVKKLRADMKTDYSDLVNYVFTMTKAANTDEFIQSLSVINTVRKYYSDLLAKRKPGTKTTPEIPIPPMG